MEIRLNCFNSVELNGFTKLKSIKLEIISYNLNNNILSGDVKTTGEYYKLNEAHSKGFEDIVPFEILFSDSNIKINNIFIENELFTFKETVGIKMQYEIVVEYEELKKEEDKEEEEIIEVPVEIENDENIIEVIETIQEEDEICEYLKENLEEEIKITNHFELKLNEAMSNRNSIDNNKLNFLKQKCSYKTITVYYLNQENEIEKISKENRISINNLYKNNDDFSRTHRLIINE